MPYYASMGDYYQAGDNYAAGGFLGSIGKAIGGAVKGFISGGPLGAIRGAGAAVLRRPNVTPLPPSGMSLVGGGSIVPAPGLVGFGQRVLPGGATGYEFRRRRRINPLNIKALRRAMRRAKGFERQARRVGSFFNPGKSYRLKGRARRRAK